MLTFAVLGRRQDGYDARRDPVSLLATGRYGWVQRANFGGTGALYLAAAAGLAARARTTAGSRATPVVLAGAALLPFLEGETKA